MATAETTARNVKLAHGFEVSWRGHIWSRQNHLTEYTVVGTRTNTTFRGEHDTGLTVRHEADGTWTARVDGEVIEICRTKTDAQRVIEFDWLGL